MFKSILAIGAAAFVVGACSSNTSSDNVGTLPQSLSYDGQCTSEVCPAPPEKGVKETCASNGGVCTWSHDDSTVSWSSCDDSKCGNKPVIHCTSGLEVSSQECGSKNGAACAWHSICSPAPSNEPCAPESCGPQTEIGIVCDGGHGHQECVRTGRRCEWQAKCP